MGEIIFVGLGMSKPEDMSVKALETLRSSDKDALCAAAESARNKPPSCTCLSSPGGLG